MFFSIAPQTVTLPDGSTICFMVEADSSLVSLVAGTHKVTFKRNGALLSTTELPAPTKIDEAPALKDDGPIPTVPGTPIPAAEMKPTDPPLGLARDRYSSVDSSADL